MIRPDQIAQLSTWLAATDITVLELRGPDGCLRLEQAAGLADAATQDTAATPVVKSASVTIVATTPGVFLHHHPLHTSALAQPGTDVAADQILGLLQIGLLLLPVRAPCAGRVEGLWVAHGTPVGFAADLIELQAAQGSP